jgi:hypothetical protein
MDKVCGVLFKTDVITDVDPAGKFICCSNQGLRNGCSPLALRLLIRHVWHRV